MLDAIIYRDGKRLHLCYTPEGWRYLPLGAVRRGLALPARALARALRRVQP